MQIRKTFIQLFGAPASIIPLSPLISITGQRLIVPVYHVITDEYLPHIKNLYNYKNRAVFESDLDFILKHYKPVDVQSVIAHVNKTKEIIGNAFLLTFDDGLREFHDVIAPILLRKGIPAVCFCNTDFIDNRDLFFRYKVSLLIDQISKNKKVLQQPEIKAWFQINFNADVTHFKSALLGMRYSEKSFLDNLASEIDLDINAFLQNNQPYLTSEQISSLQSKGFAFGAHSKDHPEYRFISIEEQVEQTTSSLEVMQKKYNASESLFAFPFTDYGVTKLFFDKIAAMENSPTLTFGCAGLKQDCIANNLQRIPLEIANKSAEEILTTEYIYFIAKSCINKNRITRD
ncbi:MAG: polysaccharide deacetylase family protein [Chitinophagales bacterium]|nr:polysaccharide deacetylase family protein [Chitinophagales bacterium]MBP8752822.1 polysaccharide deacetylase family protein [Chitinophagales bacterium]MBP9189480.1 polysaccharide deacetylase family protein [Chitinophagales bacterium]MBP9547954.1 polysaccharide deacetylase family protein [Chitinophagales bacterium]